MFAEICHQNIARMLLLRFFRIVLLDRKQAKDEPLSSAVLNNFLGLSHMSWSLPQ